MHNSRVQVLAQTTHNMWVSARGCTQSTFLLSDLRINRRFILSLWGGSPTSYPRQLLETIGVIFDLSPQSTVLMKPITSLER